MPSTTKRAVTVAIAAASLAHDNTNNNSAHALDDGLPAAFEIDIDAARVIGIVSNAAAAEEEGAAVDNNEEGSAAAADGSTIIDVSSSSEGRQQLIEISASNSTNNIMDTTRSLQTSAYKSLTTTYNSTGSFAGQMFQIKANKRLILRALDINIFKPSVGVEIYVKRGNFKGYERTKEAWTLWYTDTLSSSGEDEPTSIPMNKFPRMTIEQGEIRSFYIGCPSGSCLRYTKEGYKTYRNDELTYYGNGAAKMKGWDGLYVTPRTFNGAFYYETLEKNEPEVNFLLGFPTPPPTSQPTSEPTFSPSREPSRRPTRQPSRQPSRRPTRRPTERPTQQPTTEAMGNISGDFRLRLFWKKGYYWQESTREMFWCMKCGGDCDNGSSIYLDWCGSSSRQKFVAIGDTIRPDRDKDLCLTITGTNEDKPVRAIRCESGNVDQKFSGLRGGGSSFELKPKKYGSSRCLTQQHHPKKYERVFPQECSTAKGDETHMWQMW